MFVSSWMRKHIFRLPAEVEYVPRHRRVLYIVYSLLSGVYSYLLMAFVVIFVYHILRSYTPEWAWLPALLLGLRIFKSRIVMLERFMKTVYLDKKERVFAWFTPAPLGAGGSGAAGVAVRAHLARVRRWPFRAGAGAQNPGPHRSAGNRGGGPRR